MINFGAGPAALFPEVKQSLADAMIEVDNSGYSIGELPHRSKVFATLLAEANALVKDLLDLSSSYEVLWIQGGGRMQFAMLPMNFLTNGQSAGYIDTGFWAHDAYAHAKHYGSAKILASSAATNYTSLPSLNHIDDSELAYIHLTSNNTIYGTQYKHYPQTCVPLIGDMSSDIFGLPIDATQFKMMYAVAQKNIGISGVTLVVIDKEFAQQGNKDIPEILRYDAYCQHNSLINTAPVVAIYSCLLTLRHYKKIGLSAIQEQNKQKSEVLYSYIIQHEVLRLIPEADFSQMNVCCTWGNANWDYQFIQFAAANGIVGVEGHRRVGGLRISLYNAVQLKEVQNLIEVMEAFYKQFL